MNIYVLGHRGPDLDSVAGAVGYAEFLQKAARYPKHEIIPSRCDEINKETEYIFDKFKLSVPQKISASDIGEEDRVVLVDHNEEDQRMEGIDSTKILEIVDHHKIKINFSTPIRIDVRPLGSVSSVVYENYVKEGINPSSGTAKLMLSAILSDTQGLKSSTTTGWDTRSAEDLSKGLMEIR